MTDGSVDDDQAKQKATHCFTSVGSGKVEVKNQQNTEAGGVAVQEGNTAMWILLKCITTVLIFSEFHTYKNHLHLYTMN